MRKSKRIEWAVEALLPGEAFERVRVYRNETRREVFTECQLVMFGRRLHIAVRH
jgi:hypothetical protein